MRNQLRIKSLLREKLADYGSMGLLELSDLLEKVRASLDEVEFKLTSLSLMAGTNRHKYLVRASRDVAKASANLMQLEAERIALVSHMSREIGCKADANISEIVDLVGSPWKERLSTLAQDLKEALERISLLQGEVRSVCQARMGVFDAALTLIGGQNKTYGSSGTIEESSSRILSENL